MSGRTTGFLMWALAAASWTPVANAQEWSARQVVAPAQDIVAGVVRLPAPSSLTTVSSARIAPIRFVQSGRRWIATFDLAVEREGGWTLLLAAPAAANWRVLAAPRGAPLRDIDASFALERRVGLAGDELPGWVLDRRDLRGAPAGDWVVRIEADRASDATEGWLLASASGDVRAEAFVTTHELVRGGQAAVAARAFGSEVGAVERATLAIDTGLESRELAMFDDGEHDDGLANDGWFGAWLPDDLVGRLTDRAELRGSTREGRTFVRSAQLAFTLLEPALVLEAEARASRVDSTTWNLALEAAPLDAPRRFHVSAEVWGRTNGVETPVCWLSKMLTPTLNGARWSLELAFDERWLDVAGASGPLELRNVRVQDPDTEGVLASLAVAPLVAPRLIARAPSSVAPTASTLLAQVNTPTGPLQPVAPQLIHPALMLVHGYCSSGSIWPAADFTQPKLEFLDPNANRSHDQFAQLLAARAQSAQLSSFGVVAHSQGGPAALHLLTYYTSGLDLASGGRRIQSLASPYQGTPLASLGFFACGVNDNMTTSGAPLWLAGIPTWARAEVSYWTTSNSGSACNFFTGLLLTDPEDGTVEQTRCQLPGANSMGHTVGWCHTTGMSNPANYTDHARNQTMNGAAAR